MNGAAGPHEAEIERLKDQVADLESMFELRHKADMRAIKRWRKATGRKLVLPDHADLCIWLLDQLNRK